jgi:uncharacterized protein YbaR (Trm112 family)
MTANMTAHRDNTIDPQLLELLRCPQDHSELHFANGELIGRLNRLIPAGKVVNVGGQVVRQTMDGGLVRSAGDLLYPIVSGIPVMLVDEAIDIRQM